MRALSKRCAAPGRSDVVAVSLPLPDQVRIVEVGPRDGLQNEAAKLPTHDKIRLLQALVRAGLKEVEITSFTHPRWIPNLADAEEVARAAADLPVQAFALVPNRRGLERAIKAGVAGITLVMSASDGHNRANLNRSRGESLSELIDLQREAAAEGLTCRISLSVVFGCPFEGVVPADEVTAIVRAFADNGAARIGLCDTIGVADPAQVHRLSRLLRGLFPQVEFELHLHDTHGRALANTLAGMQAGIVSFDTSVGGLGGCPYAPGATGNVSTELTAAMLARMDIATGIDVAMLAEARMILAQGLGKRFDPSIERAA
ncbi:MAG: hydroxymethylglutaryl-CoA lyase [Rhizobiaceae bacterium]|nr:hydroxymethylglutaryl-CoA lyase [Rhizobiaceae bacterium]